MNEVLTPGCFLNCVGFGSGDYERSFAQQAGLPHFYRQAIRIDRPLPGSLWSAN